jgi:flagellar hook-associated protein 3 FlgL
MLVLSRHRGESIIIGDSIEISVVDIQGEQIKMIANSTYGSKYIFGGTNVTEKPLQQDDDGSLKWVGNDNSIRLEIAAGIEFAINITNGGTSSNSLQNFFFADSNSDPDQDQGIFTVLRNLVQDIRAGNLDEDSSALEILDNKLTNLLTARSTIGAKVNRLELQRNRMESMSISLTGLLSKNEDADMAEVIMNLKMQENVYRAALAAGARIIQPTLIDFLR